MAIGEHATLSLMGISESNVKTPFIFIFLVVRPACMVTKIHKELLEGRANDDKDIYEAP